jgi:hypothetical protein
MDFNRLGYLFNKFLKVGGIEFSRNSVKNKHRRVEMICSSAHYKQILT